MYNKYSGTHEITKMPRWTKMNEMSADEKKMEIEI